MKIKVEVSQDELEEMFCNSVEEFTQQLRKQLDDAVVDDEGRVGEDWMVEYDLDVTVN